MKRKRITFCPSLEKLFLPYIGYVSTSGFGIFEYCRIDTYGVIYDFKICNFRLVTIYGFGPTKHCEVYCECCVHLETLCVCCGFCSIIRYRRPEICVEIVKEMELSII